MIIGSDYLPYINCEGSRIFENCLEARESHFGWYLSGPVPTESIRTFKTTVLENMDISKELKLFWELEEAEVPKAVSDDAKFCEQFYSATTYRGDDGKYVVRLPFKQQFPTEINLGPTRHMAFAQYRRRAYTYTVYKNFRTSRTVSCYSRNT